MTVPEKKLPQIHEKMKTDRKEENIDRNIRGDKKKQTNIPINKQREKERKNTATMSSTKMFKSESLAKNNG